MRIKNTKILNYISTGLISLFLLMTFLLAGCTDTLDGEVNENLKPIVEFANIPPDDQEFSRNPEVYWIGTDVDGLIDYYRYCVIPASSVSGDPMTYADGLDDTMWVQVDIDLSDADPKTTNVISLSADLNDPVNNYVSQYIFLQAFDLEGLGSDIVYKVLRRNDNPPETEIRPFSEDVFVNSVLEGGVITGVRMAWEGSDRKDYEDLGLTAPPFEFEWRLYGPFDSADSLILEDSLKEIIFVSEDARIFRLGDTLISCDTTIGDNDTIICDTTIFDQVFMDTTSTTPFLTKDTLYRIDWAPDLFNQEHLVANSWNGTDVWVTNTADTIYNVYRNMQLDTTAQMNFVFWIRSRDDAFVRDLTPEFVMFPVIEPRYERDIAVIDFTKLSSDITRYRHIDTAKAFWYNTIHNWAAQSSLTGGSIIFDTARFAPGTDPLDTKPTGIDYIRAGYYSTTGIPLRLLLKHKTLILYNDWPDNSGFVSANKVQYPEILSAMDASISVWATWRMFHGENNNNLPQFVNVPQQYTDYFGVLGGSFSRWFWQAFIDPMIRTEDFVGTYSLDESSWPSLDLDENLLQSRYDWQGTYIDSIPALPEVSWTSRAFGTEVMYLYKSLYGSTHPYGALYKYEGAPCGHRYLTNLYKSVHFGFTLMAMDTTQAQDISNSVLEWLFNPNLASLADKGVNRYPNAAVKISLDEAQKRYQDRLEDK